MLKVLLCIPPAYDCNFPPLGTPALSAFLKSKGIPALQKDLNIAYRDFLAGKIKTSSPVKEKKALLAFTVNQFFAGKLKNRYYSAFLPGRSDKIFPYLPYDNNTNSSYHFAERMLSSRHLRRYLEDEKENTFLQFYRESKFLDFLAKEKINLLGISIIAPSQALASLTLGRLVKKHLPHVHVVIGGQWPTLYRNELAKRKDFFSFYGSIIVFEGETPLYNLALALNSGQDISALPNVITKENRSRFRFNHMGENMNSLPCPDFDGLPLRDPTRPNIGVYESWPKIF